MKSIPVLLVTVALLLPATPAPAAAQIGPDPAPEDPTFEVVVPDPTLTPGTSQTLTVQLVNDDEEVDQRVYTARNVEVTPLRGDTPFTIRSGTRVVDRMPDGVYRSIDVRLGVPANVDAGTYEIPLKLRYEFETDESDRTTVYAKVRVEERARFVVEDTESTVAVGGGGAVRVRVTNVGERAATDASVRFESPAPEILFGESSRASRFVGRWEPGETRTVGVDATATADAETRSYTVSARVLYEDEDGSRQTSRELTTGITPRPEQTFEIRNLSSTLYVGEPGTVRGTVANTGPRPVGNAVLVYASSNPTVHPVDTEVSLGRLRPGESSDFSFEVAVTEQASASERPLTLVVRYRDPEGDRRSSDTLEPTVSLSPEREWLSVTAENATFEIDTDNRMTVRVRNTESVPLEDVQARLRTEQPFTTDSRLAYVPRLEPGESETLAFEVTVDEDAVPTRSAVRVNVTATRPDGEGILLDTYVVPVTVTEDASASSSTLFAAGAIIALVVLLGGWWWLRR
jgi:hypothetical protein